MKNFLYWFLNKWNWFDAIKKGRGMQRFGRVYMLRGSGSIIGKMWKF